jgi:hypothetical protein
MAALYRICAKLMILLGPMLWAALIVLFLWAEFFNKISPGTRLIRIKVTPKTLQVGRDLGRDPRRRLRRSA